MIDYDVGDVVVMVRQPNWSHAEAPPLGKPVRAKKMMANHFGQIVVTIEGFPSLHPTGMWQATHFRKLPKATDEFAEMMRRMKPKSKPQVDA